MGSGTVYGRQEEILQKKLKKLLCGTRLPLLQVPAAPFTSGRRVFGLLPAGDRVRTN
jgi:hypothetical protein